uniref:Uncharacterized protein n=1 Tax=viral metagenome TaxID=1070528 RepID=A0A6H1ZWV4_9ZZZZ
MVSIWHKFKFFQKKPKELKYHKKKCLACETQIDIVKEIGGEFYFVRGVGCKFCAPDGKKAGFIHF